jgi:hypothetical protein
VASSILLLAVAGIASGAECGDSQYHMQFFEIGGQAEHVTCSGLPGAISSVVFTDARTGNTMTGIHASNFNGNSFDIKVDSSVPPSRPNMYVNGQGLGRQFRFFPPNQAGIMDASTEYTRNQFNKLSAEIAVKSFNSRVTTKVVVDTKTRTRLTNLEGRVDAMRSEIKKAAEAPTVTMADLQRLAAENPEGLKAFIAQFAPVITMGSDRAGIVAEAIKYTDHQIESEVRPVSDRVTKLEAALAPTGALGQKIARSDAGTRALLAAKLKPAGTNKESRKEALMAAWAMYPTAPAEPAKAKGKNKK